MAAESVKKKRASSPKNQDKKDLAKLLYTQNNLNQKEVAERVGITPKTMGEWIRVNEWDKMRKSLLVTRKEQLSNLLDQLAELTEVIKGRPKGQRYANPKEGDTQGKIAAAIKKLSTDAGLNETMEVMTLLIGFIQKNFPEKLNSTIPMLDAFVKQYL